MQKILDQATKDNDKYGEMQRFGYFSIPVNNLLGDCYYSQEKEFNHKVIDRVVVSEKRGIWTQPGKSGKNHDAYFQSLDTTDNNVQKRLEEGLKSDYDKLMKKVNERKNKQVEVPFKYPGAQTYKDFYDKNPFKRNYPIDKDPPKHYKVVDQKVIIENRGIYTQPMKKGFNNTPGILFKFTPLGHDKDEKLDIAKIKKLQDIEHKKRCVSACPPQTAYKKAFFPASLKKNEPFFNIQQTYGYEPKYYDKLKKESDAKRKSNEQKFERKNPPGSFKHDRPFTPASLSKIGREGLFDQKIWNCPSIPEKIEIVNAREKAERERKNRRDPFIYNRLQDASKFSPSIVNNQINLKHNYPTVFNH